MSAKQLPEKDCTPKCRSRSHAKLLLNSVIKGSPAQIRSYCIWLCHNFAGVSDTFGHNVLHYAASCGKWEIVEWLIECCHSEVDVKDSESGWTALHRSLFYGQITAARILLNHDASTRVTDRDGLTPLGLLVKDRLPYIEYNLTYPQDVYVWGTNTHFNLGLGDQQSRANPEILEIFQKENTGVKQVVICKYHSAFLTSDGRVLTCGHGLGGRLGQGSETTELSPSAVQGLGSSVCQEIAAGQDHLIFLTEDGQVWTCGLNSFHQLGHSPPPSHLLAPKSIPLKLLKGKKILGVRASRFHSLFYTKDSLYTFGLNAGQLGCLKGANTQISPYQTLEENEITHVAASDGATVFATNHGNVYAIHEFKRRIIASRQLNCVEKITVVGGKIDADVGNAKSGGTELKVLILHKSGLLYLWQETNPSLSRCLFTSSKSILISDVYLNQCSVAMVTFDNQAYIGTFVTRNEKETRSLPSNSEFPKSSTSLSVLLSREDHHFIRPKSLPHVYRAAFITSDPTGQNFAVLQTCPKVGLLELPVVSESKIQQHCQKLLEESSLLDTIHDIVIEVGSKEHPAHKYILATRSAYFMKQLVNEDVSSLEVRRMVLENIPTEAFEQVLKFLYSNSCDFLVEGQEIKWIKDAVKNNEGPVQKNGIKKKSKVKNELLNPLKCMQRVSKFLNITALSKALETIQLINNKVHIQYEKKFPKMKFDRNNLINFHDVCLRSKENEEFRCHKCILVARSDYFSGMLGSSCWVEKTHLESLQLPIPSNILSILLKYIYSDTEGICDIQDLELLCNLLAVADQLLMNRLKEMCEVTLVNLLTLKNAPELLQLGQIYNANQMKTSAMEFICINLPSILELKNIDVISFDVMEELTQMYRRMSPRSSYRVLTPYSGQPSREDLELVENSYPVDEDTEIVKQDDSSKSKSKNKRRTKSQTIKTKMLIDSKNMLKLVSDTFDHASISFSDKKDTKEVVAMTRMPKEEIVEAPKEKTNILTEKQPGQRTLSCPSRNAVLSLDEIMAQEREMTMLTKPTCAKSDMKHFPRLSQKQKKLLGLSPESKDNKIAKDMQEPQSPPPCAWGKCTEVPSAPFWDSPINDSNTRPNVSSITSPNSVLPQTPKRSPAINVPTFVSFSEIQRDEAAALTLAKKPKSKPLHLINIEDQAIEELLVLYKACNNPDEKVTISRVLPEHIARPTWCKQTNILAMSP